MSRFQAQTSPVTSWWCHGFKLVAGWLPVGEQVGSRLVGAGLRADGQQGIPGPPFANTVVDGTNTMPPGSPAYVSAIFDGTNVRFVFDIPQGMPGEVTVTDLNNAIYNVAAGSSSNSNGVAELLPTNPNPTLLEVAQKLDELILALRR